MKVFKILWQEFITTFRAARLGGEAAARLKDSWEMERISEGWAKAKTSEERDAARDQVKEWVLRGTPGRKDPP